ncbi:uncharacterized protein SRS1_13062 [Sporisorium reilianum f. sp. reilianum]|uniref:Uncharacterized protein n=1 Tax=Sporisorium reilianum f. sp. reilianum TaxID=72559 RepID=A0A2N8UB22_9BASI|nr:uncharacterized protein SRS1_13062 [Sporisorium reilianum f. sp. reilianum]
MSSVHPVLTLINRCDALAQQFDTTFSASCTLLTDMANGVVAPGGPQTMDDTLSVLRSTLERCEAVVGEMLGCIYADIPLLLDQLDAGEGKEVGSWNARQALDGISQLFYSYQDLLTDKRELLADFTCEEVSPSQFIQRWTSIDATLASQRKQQVDDLADLLAAF